MNIKGAIFDFDGTLADSLGFWEWQYDELGKKYLGGEKIALTPEDDKKFRTSLIVDCVKLLHQKYGIGDSEEELFDYINQSIRNFYVNEVKPKKGVIEFLKHLKQKGVKTCIASATAEDELRLAVKSCGLDGYFDFLISCSEFGVGKDKPDVFLSALERLGTPLGDTWVFEDSLVALETSKKIGLNTVGIMDKNNPYTENQLKNFSDIYISSNMSMADVIENF